MNEVSTYEKMMQTFFGNPIAGPYVLGISAGSKLFVAITMIIALNYVSAISTFMMVGAAFVGALISMGFVLLAAVVFDIVSKKKQS